VGEINDFERLGDTTFNNVSDDLPGSVMVISGKLLYGEIEIEDEFDLPKISDQKVERDKCPSEVKNYSKTGKKNKVAQHFIVFLLYIIGWILSGVSSSSLKVSYM